MLNNYGDLGKVTSLFKKYWWLVLMTGVLLGGLIGSFYWTTTELQTRASQLEQQIESLKSDIKVIGELIEDASETSQQLFDLIAINHGSEDQVLEILKRYVSHGRYRPGP